MNEITSPKRIVIKNDLDIVVARLQAREIARDLGFNTSDQARISLAAGEIAKLLSSKGSTSGEILIAGVSNEQQVGIQVITTKLMNGHTRYDYAATEKWSEDTLSAVLPLIDEGFVDQDDNRTTRVTLRKWRS
ncbi:MAG TPA: hypothetical protein VLL52_17795 [Anaerolineae bacterium]|nr:hypothetical protein [Anaerolineae bacterium]